MGNSKIGKSEILSWRFKSSLNLVLGPLFSHEEKASSGNDYSI